MATTIEKVPARRVRDLLPYWSSPFERFFGNDFLDFDALATVPPINVTEEKNSYIVNMAVPGFKKDDFDINLEGNLLTISCQKETETDGKESNAFSRREYNYSSFSRTVTLPEYADNKGITAKYTDGVLNLTIPKKPEAQKLTGQKIKIQ